MFDDWLYHPEKNCDGNEDANQPTAPFFHPEPEAIDPLLLFWGKLENILFDLRIGLSGMQSAWGEDVDSLAAQPRPESASDDGDQAQEAISDFEDGPGEEPDENSGNDITAQRSRQRPAKTDVR